MRDYQALHLDINKSKGTAVLYFTIIADVAFTLVGKVL
jgi:hypothetical protein